MFLFFSDEIEAYVNKARSNFVRPKTKPKVRSVADFFLKKEKLPVIAESKVQGCI